MTNYSKDELNPPDWLNKEFFEDILRTYKRDSKVTLDEFLITPGTAAGEHFASIMFKVAVNFRTGKGAVEEMKLIMKLIPQEEGIKKEILKDMPWFKNEIRMYTRVLPEMERVLAQADINITFAPP